MKKYALYRYVNSDGSTKDWAITIEDESFTTRWGKTGNKLASFSTKPLARFDHSASHLVLSKQRKGYQRVGAVWIDDEGVIQNDAPESLATAMDVEATLFWRIKVPASVQNGQQLELNAWAYQISHLESLLNDAICIGLLMLEHSAPGYVGSWKIPSVYSSSAGQTLESQGITPLLILMAMKKTAPEGVTVSLSTNDGTEIGSEIRKEGDVLGLFGTDLTQIRPQAELLGLVERPINFAVDIKTEEDCWF